MPPFIIIPSPSRPPTCPECGKPERRVDVCGHCDYHYPTQQLDGGDLILIWLCVAGAVLGSVLMGNNINGPWDHQFSLVGALLGFLLGGVLTMLGVLAIGGFAMLVAKTFHHFTK